MSSPNVRNNSLGLPINYTMEEFYASLIGSAVGITEGGLLDILKGLPANKNSSYIIAFCIYASMSVKDQVEGKRNECTVTFPQSMMVEEKVNMSVLAQIGHIVMMIDESRFTPFGLTRKSEYRKAIGGALNISKFERFRDGTSNRDMILKKYRESISGFDMRKFEKVIVPLAPTMFTASYSSVVWNKVTSPFAGTFRFGKSAVRTLVVKPAWYIFLIVAVSTLAVIFLGSFKATNSAAVSALLVVNPDVVEPLEMERRAIATSFAYSSTMTLLSAYLAPWVVAAEGLFTLSFYPRVVDTYYDNTKESAIKSISRIRKEVDFGLNVTAINEAGENAWSFLESTTISAKNLAEEFQESFLINREEEMLKGESQDLKKDVSEGNTENLERREVIVSLENNALGKNPVEPKISFTDMSQSGKVEQLGEISMNSDFGISTSEKKVDSDIASDIITEDQKLSVDEKDGNKLSRESFPFAVSDTEASQ